MMGYLWLLMIFTATHYSTMNVRGSGPRPQLAENATDAERGAAFTPFTANGGTYTLSGTTLTLRRSIAKSPNRMNTTSTAEVRFEGDDTVWLTLRVANGTINVIQKWVRAEDNDVL